MSQFVLHRLITGCKTTSLSPLCLAVRAPTRGRRHATGDTAGRSLGVEQERKEHVARERPKIGIVYG